MYYSPHQHIAVDSAKKTSPKSIPGLGQYYLAPCLRPDTPSVRDGTHSFGH